MKTANVNWNEGNVATLKALWIDGVSAPEISKAITGSVDHKNAVVGKAHRLGLGPHPRGRELKKANGRRNMKKSHKRKREATPPKEKREKALVIAKLAPRMLTGDPMPADLRYMKGAAWEALPGTTPKPLEALAGHGECRWPLGSGPFLFCAAPTEEHRRYTAKFITHYQSGERHDHT